MTICRYHLVLAAIWSGVSAVGCGSSQEPAESTIEHGLQANALTPLSTVTPTVCWVHDPNHGSHPGFLSEVAVIEATFREWEIGTALEFQFVGLCSGSATETIRILWDETGWSSASGTIPGCSRPSSAGGDGSWASYPSQAASYAGCQWNFSLNGSGAGIQLHEMGHKIGFSHEKHRSDGVCNRVCATNDDCTQDDATCQSGRCVNDDRFLTTFDRDSIMHYGSSCAPGGGDSLSSKDSLGAEIFYPPSSHVKLALGAVEVSGWQVIREDALVQTLWGERGAVDANLTNIEWTASPISGPPSVVATSPSFVWRDVMGSGAWSGTLAVTFEDRLGRAKDSEDSFFVSTELHTAVLMTAL
jgi:hypothetical protein